MEMLNSVFAMETVRVGGSRMQRGWNTPWKTDKPLQEFFPERRRRSHVEMKAQEYPKLAFWHTGGWRNERGKNCVYQVFLLGIVKQWEEAEAKYPGYAGQAPLPCTWLLFVICGIAGLLSVLGRKTNDKRLPGGLCGRRTQLEMII